MSAHRQGQPSKPMQYGSPTRLGHGSPYLARVLTDTKRRPAQKQLARVIARFVVNVHMAGIIRPFCFFSPPWISKPVPRISNDQQLISQARVWSQTRNNIGRGGIIVVAFIGVLLLWRLAPEYNCQNCGHNGRKKDLIDEVYCPNCKRPYDRVVP